MPNRDRGLRKMASGPKKTKQTGLMRPLLKARQRDFKAASWYVVTSGRLSAARTNTR
jgi:hypothetical protein